MYITHYSFITITISFISTSIPHPSPHHPLSIPSSFPLSSSFQQWEIMVKGGDEEEGEEWE